MAVQRYISSSFWSDDWVDSLTGLEKLLYMYLLTNECTSICGVYKITIKRMKDDTGIPREEVMRMLDVFAKAKKAFYFEEYIILPKWLKHQNINNLKVKLGITRALQALPENIINFLRAENHFYYNIDDFLIEKSKPKTNEAPDNKTMTYPENGIAYPKNGISHLENAEKSDSLYPNDRNSADNSNLNLNSNLTSLDILTNLERGGQSENPQMAGKPPEQAEPAPFFEIPKPEKKRKCFVKPTIPEIANYCNERKNGVDPVAFYNFYESKDWYVGKNKMKNWKACVHTWEQRQHDFKKQHPPFSQNDFSKQDFSESSVPEVLRPQQKIEIDVGEALESVPF
ncbi:hypothetical protein [Treponema pedis]|uniref:hypothetical protein n=1 Tax=Treponema pedis TaxID=409322 RepID=UPI000405893D|nr:hypothetical protein [Treponema pedis]